MYLWFASPAFAEIQIVFLKKIIFKLTYFKHDSTRHFKKYKTCGD